MRRVLVTGATGFVGTHTLPLLRARGFEVHAVGRTAPLGTGISFHRADLLAAAERRAVVAEVQPSHLLHLAWYAEPGLYWTSAQNLDWVAASLDLVQAFVAAGGERLVVAGSCAEYAWGSARLHELATPCRPATLYGAAKDGLRRLLDAYAGSTELSLAWARLFYLYGPGEGRGRLVGDAVQALLKGEPFPTTMGRQCRDFLHVADAAAALAALLDGAVTGPVNVGSGKAVPIRRILDGIAARTGGSERIAYGVRALPSTDPAVIEADTARLTSEVGFRTHYDWDSGLDETVGWWRERLAIDA